MRTSLVLSLAGIGLLALSACRSEENPAPDLSFVPDFSVADLTGADLTSIDLAGVDLTKLPDLLNVDLYTPLFKTAVPYTAESGPIFLAAGDLNKDGKRDLVVVNTNNPAGAVPSTVSVLLGNGDGTFQTKVSVPTDPSPRAVAIADLNGDTNPDVIVAVQDGFQVFLGNGSATLGSPTKTTIATTYISSIALGDIDGDGKLDAVLADLGVLTGKAWVSRGDGAGGFATPISFEVTASATVYSTIAARLGDMNNDGKIDIVTVNSEYPSATTNTIAILTNTSVSGTVSMSATPTEIAAGFVPFDLLIAQLDGANKLDIVVANRGDNDVSVYLSDTAGSALSFGARKDYPVPGGPIALAFGDVDADSKVDILTANTAASTVTVLYGGGSAGLFAQSTANRPGTETYPTGTNPTSIVAATFNSDVKVDVATADDGAGTVSVLINQR